MVKPLYRNFWNQLVLSFSDQSIAEQICVVTSPLYFSKWYTFSSLFYIAGFKNVGSAPSFVDLWLFLIHYSYKVIFSLHKFRF